MSCSGIQILSSIIGDEKAMEFTNVFPGEEPKDAYGEVARCARQLLQNKEWLRDKFDKYKKQNLKWNKKHPDQKPRDIRMFHEIDLNILDRSIAKKPVMLTGYGGSLLRKREHIFDELKERKLDLHYQDKKLIVASLIEGMTLAFPRYEHLNAWFKEVVKEAVEAGVGEMKWVSPNGSIIVQDYREPLFSQVDTHAASGGHYSQILSDESGSTYVQTGWGGIQARKHQTACAANLTHSLDATIIQTGINRLEEGVDCVTVHDCLYFQPGYNEKVSPVFRQAFYGVVTTPVLQSYLDENKLKVTDIQNPQTEHERLHECVESGYMFS
jgi:DNA-directed RNA polymerase